MNRIKVKTTKSELITRQTRIMQMIATNQCSVTCAGAIHVDSPCNCRCLGSNHGALWFDEIAIEHPNYRETA